MVFLAESHGASRGKNDKAGRNDSLSVLLSLPQYRTCISVSPDRSFFSFSAETSDVGFLMNSELLLLQDRSE